MIKNKAAIFILIIVFLAFAGAAVYFFRPQKERLAPTVQPKIEILTREEIQEALSKKAEPSTGLGSLTEEKISQALNKKNPSSEKTAPLTPEEIQKALQTK